MCNKIIIPLIYLLREGDSESYMKVYAVFERLILHYSKKMCCEDGRAELNLFLTELLHRLDLSQFCEDDSFGVQKYIAVSIRNRFIDISKKGCQYLKNVQPLLEVADTFDEYIDEKIILPEALSRLSKKQKAVLQYEYFEGYSEVEISRIMGIGRQAVNGLKLRALSKMKKFYK